MTTRMPRTDAGRPGLGEDWRAVWEVAHYTLTEDGDRGPTCLMTQLEAHPLTSNVTVAHSAFVRLTQDPKLPEVDMMQPQARLLGYTASHPDADGQTPLVHGVRCAKCGSDQVGLTVRQWAVCRACGHGQTHGEAFLCSDHCAECDAKGLSE
ncbi:hypothetical protein ABCR94_00600 [Streptomyces sp. 21So2-11]|uniref:hypothetical protein n=1 Tax=Streptomyces sp. 21So2-11 TaxID=3144408 RepID=UPI00321AA4C7